MATKKCTEIADQAIRIHNIATALTRGWDRLPKASFGGEKGIDETLSGLKKRVQDLMKSKVSGTATNQAKEVLSYVEQLEQHYNLKPPYGKEIKSDDLRLAPKTLELVVDSILDCGCRESGYLIEWDKNDTEPE